MSGKISVLWVAAQSEPRPRLLEEMGAARTEVIHALTCDEARRRLAERSNFGLVVASAHLTDGNWYSVLSSLVHQGSNAGLVVVADEVTDSFRQRVRDHGAIDAVALGAKMRSVRRVSNAVRAACA